MRIITSTLMVCTIVFVSCVTQRNVEYMQDSSKSILSFDEAEMTEYRLKANDELYIQISSLDDPTASIYSVAGTQQLMNISTIQPYGASLLSYTVEVDGFLLLPVIGRISVVDKTVPEVREAITDALKNILSQPMVTVKLVNRYISVLGEVRTPGHFSYVQDKISIFDAIGLAGDITDYGDRKEVLLARNVDGENLRILVDLTKSDIMESEYYYIRPNDIVYVKPMRKRFWAMREFPYSILLSSFTTAILLYSVVR